MILRRADLRVVATVPAPAEGRSTCALPWPGVAIYLTALCYVFRHAYADVTPGGHCSRDGSTSSGRGAWTVCSTSGRPHIYPIITVGVTQHIYRARSILPGNSHRIGWVSGATHTQKHGRGCVRIPPCGHNIRRRRLPEVNWYLSLVNGGPPRQGVPAAALCHVIPALFAMLIGIFRAHPYYASRKYHPPFADRMAARLGVPLELAQPTGSCAPASVPTSADGGSSSAGPSSGTCLASEYEVAHDAQARPQAAHRSGGSRAESADGTS